MSSYCLLLAAYLEKGRREMAINPVISSRNYWPKQGVDKRVRHLQEATALAQGLPRPKESSELQKASQEFESLFIYFLLKTMRGSIPSSTFLGKGPGEDMYISLFDQEIAKNIAQGGGIGISEMMMRKLSDSNQTIKHLDSTLPYLKKPLGDKEQPGEESSLSKPEVFSRPNKAYAIYSEEELEKPAENPPTKTRPGNGERVIEEKSNEAGKEYTEYILPLSGKVTSHFGLRKDPFNDKVCFHAGIDLAMATGSEIRAAYPGKVIFSGRKDGYGNLVVLQHDNNYTTCYAHNSKNLVNEGDVVEAGQTIALVGDTGRTTGPHLHFEVRESGIPIDPTKVVGLDA